MNFRTTGLALLSILALGNASVSIASELKEGCFLTRTSGVIDCNRSLPEVEGREACELGDSDSAFEAYTQNLEEVRAMLPDTSFEVLRAEFKSAEEVCHSQISVKF